MSKWDNVDWVLLCAMLTVGALIFGLGIGSVNGADEGLLRANGLPLSVKVRIQDGRCFAIVDGESKWLEPATAEKGGTK